MSGYTLDLFGERTRRFHRPRVAAAGLILLAAGNIIMAIVLTLSVTGTALISDYFTFLRLQITIALFDSLLGVAGLVLLAFANLVPDITPWPRRLMLWLGLADYGLCLLAYGLLLAQSDVFTLFDFYTHVYWYMMMAAIGLGVIAWSFALVYALHLARWLGSRFLARASLLAIVPQLVALMAYGVFFLIIAKTHVSRTPAVAIHLALVAARIAAVLAIAAYLAGSALFLFKKARA